MHSIDEILDLLVWTRSAEEQQKGRMLAREVESVHVFLMPLDRKHNKNVWDNCAIILSERSDDELRPYIDRMLEWVEDLNYPGALTVLERLMRYEDKEWLLVWLCRCMKIAKALHEEMWTENLHMLKTNLEAL